MSVAAGKDKTSAAPRRRRRASGRAGDRLEHTGRHAEHIGATLGTIAQLLGPGPPSASDSSADTLARAELEDEESEDE